MTITVNLPSHTFGELAPSEPEFNPSSQPASNVSTKRASPVESPASRGKKLKASLDLAAVATALEAYDSQADEVAAPSPTARDHQKDRQTFQRSLAHLAMVRDQCCVVTRNPLEDLDNNLPWVTLGNCVKTKTVKCPLFPVMDHKNLSYAEWRLRSSMITFRMSNDGQESGPAPILFMVGVRNAQDTQCAHVLPPSVAERFFKRPGAPYPACTPTINRIGAGPDSCPSFDIRNVIMLDRNLHSAYDRFLWSITGNIGHFTVFVFTQFPSVTHGQRIRFPPLLEGAPESGKTFYARRFPDVRTFRHHFEEAVRRWFRAAGEREDDTEGGGAEATGLVDEETENASVTTVAYDSGDDSDRKGGEDSGDTRQMTMQDLMDSWKPLRRTESSLTIADLLGPEIDE